MPEVKTADLGHVLLGSQGHDKIAHFEIDGGQAIQVGATAGQLPAVGVLRILQPRNRLFRPHTKSLSRSLGLLQVYEHHQTEGQLLVHLTPRQMHCCKVQLMTGTSSDKFHFWGIRGD